MDSWPLSPSGSPEIFNESSRAVNGSLLLMGTSSITGGRKSREQLTQFISLLIEKNGIIHLLSFFCLYLCISKLFSSNKKIFVEG